MKKIALCLLLFVGMVGLGFADEGDAPAFPELQRGFADGKFVDEYYGIVFTAEELKEGYGFGGGGGVVLWSGKAAGGVDVEIRVAEQAEAIDAAGWRDHMLEGFEKDDKDQKAIEKGDEPQPWILYVEESLAGFERHHGYAFFSRGHQGFQVHARVREKSDTSGEAIKKVLAGLTVSDKSDSFLMADMVAKRVSRDPRHPGVLADAGVQYMRAEPPMAAQARTVLELALKTAPEGMFSADAQWSIAQSLGLAQLTLGDVEGSLATWKKTIELAKGTEQPEAALMNSYYNLACAYSRLGRLDEAFAELEKSFETGATQGIDQMKEHAQTDPDLEPMRKDPRWAELFGS